MSWIQQVMSKAEQDGTLRRSHPIVDLATGSTATETIPAAVARAMPFPTENIASKSIETTPRVDVMLDPIHFEPPFATPRLVGAAKLHPTLVVALEPRSPVAEHYRSLRTRITQSENGSPLRVILVTSPAEGDGKTLTALNLALTMAQEFQRQVLIVDADLRRPGIHTLLGLSRGPGLADVLAGTATLPDALIELPDHHLTVLRAGESSRWPTEMLGSGQMRRLLDTLRSQFDRIILDTAPAHLADAGVLAPMTDGTVMVVRAGQTPKPAIERALGALAGAKLLGLVLNESGIPMHRGAAPIA